MVRWTATMLSDLQDCRSKALEKKTGETPPLDANGKKKKYVDILLELWNEKGYGHLRLSKDNLRVRANQLNVQNLASKNQIRQEVISQQNQQEEGNEEILPNVQEEAESLETGEFEYAEIVFTPKERETAKKIEDEATNIMEKISTHVGDFANRIWNTRTKTVPSQRNLQIINKVAENLWATRRNANACHLLWYYNCIIYALAIAWLMSQGLAKESNMHRATVNGTQRKWTPPCVSKIEREIKEIRRDISIATAELKRLQINGKLTKKGKKNREHLINNRGVKISCVSIINFIEKQKSTLKRMARKRRRKIKWYESKKWNKMYINTPTKVHNIMRESIRKDPNNLKPNLLMDDCNRSEDSDSMCFESLEQAEEFWRPMWETEGNGNPSAPWLKEIEEVMASCVRENSDNTDSMTIKEEQIWQAIKKKKNWSAPGPDGIANYWLKKITSLHGHLAKVIESVINENEALPEWLNMGRTTLFPKDGEWSSANHRPITCLNTTYKLTTSITLPIVDNHLKRHEFLQQDQRGAKEEVSGCLDNLLIDKIVLEDVKEKKRNMACAWVDVRKAYDSVDHTILGKVLEIHSFPKYLISIIMKLVTKCSITLVVKTKAGMQESSKVTIRKGLLQGDSLCPKLFTIYINPAAWKIRATDGYILSKPIRLKITQLMFIDDLKVFAANEKKLHLVLKLTQNCMKDLNMEWGAKKCAIMNVKRGKLEEQPDLHLNETTKIRAVSKDRPYKFLGIYEHTCHDSKLIRNEVSKEFLQRMWLIWSSPMSEPLKIHATNTFAIPALTYYMCTTEWTVHDLQELDREVRKILTDAGARHPGASVPLLYMPRSMGGRGMKSVEDEYIETKIKTAVHLYSSDDLRMQAVAQIDQQRGEKGRRSMMKDAEKFAAKLGVEVNNNRENHGWKIKYTTQDRTQLLATKEESVKEVLKKASRDKRRREIEGQKWLGNFTTTRWTDNTVNNECCFTWLNYWTECQADVVADVEELYQQLLPTRIYYQQKLGQEVPNTRCRLCNTKPETVAHILTGCPRLTQSEYLYRHNNAIKCLYYSLLKHYKLVRKVPSWNNITNPKPIVENNKVSIYWDVPILSTGSQVLYAQEQGNRPDVVVNDHENKEIVVVEFSCPWISNRQKKVLEKQDKYQEVRTELKRRYVDYKVNQINVIVDALGGYSKELQDNLVCLLGKQETIRVLKIMQRSVLFGSIRIKNLFKTTVAASVS